MSTMDFWTEIPNSDVSGFSGKPEENSSSPDAQAVS